MHLQANSEVAKARTDDLLRKAASHRHAAELKGEKAPSTRRRRLGLTVRTAWLVRLVQRSRA